MIKDRVAEYVNKVKSHFGVQDPDIHNFMMMEILLREHFINGSQLLNGIEIGVNVGNFDRYILEKFPNLKMTGIDSDKCPRANEDLAQFPGRWTFINSPSEEAYKLLIPPYDFVFIDGAHDYGHVKSDIDNYRPLIRKGGLLTGHDYDGNTPGVVNAVKEIENEVNIGADLVWWVYV